MFANLQDDYNLRIIDFGLAEQLEENCHNVVNIFIISRSISKNYEWMFADNVDVRDTGVHVTRGDGLQARLQGLRHVGGGGDCLPAGIRGRLSLLGGQ